MHKVKRKVSNVLPKSMLLWYHYLLAIGALIIYGNASKKMIVIGVTGTKGKTTTSIMIHSVLSGCGQSVGLISTAELRIKNTHIKNTKHMTMGGRGFVIKILRDMYRAGCKYVVVETPSEGILQYRNLGVKYDSLVFTNLAPEHLVTHKTYEAYRNIKGKLFSEHSKQNIKYIDGVPVKKYILLNADDPESKYFSKKSKSKHTKQIFFGIGPDSTHRAFLSTVNGSRNFRFLNSSYTIGLPGLMSIRNALPAIFFAKIYCNGASKEINDNLLNITLPGRLEQIEEGQDFKVFCDYAHEPLSIASVCQALKEFCSKDGKIIMISGAVGGSRWKYNAKRIGITTASVADISIFTDVDPFDDDPQEILDEVVSGAKDKSNGWHNKNNKWYAEIDRKKAIRKAFSFAKKGDVVIITGKGSEVTMEVKGGSIPWDEREIIREELRKIL